MARQVVVVDTDIVNIRHAVIATDGDVHRGSLRKVIVIRVLDNARHDAVDIDEEQSVFCSLIHNKRDANVFVLFVLSIDFRLLGFH